MTKFNEKKASVNVSPNLSNPLLSLKSLPQIDIPPAEKILTLSVPSSVSIPAVPTRLSRCSQFPIEAVPGVFNEDEGTLTTYIDGITRRTIFICNFCYCDSFISIQSIKNHLREVHKISMQPNPNYPFETKFECVS